MSATPPPPPPQNDPYGQKQPSGAPNETPGGYYAPPPEQQPQPDYYGQQQGYPHQQGYPQQGYPQQGGYPHQQQYGGYYAQQPYALPPESRPQSLMGKISIAAGILGGLATVAGFMLAGTMGNNPDPNSAQAQAVGLVVMAGMGLNLLGFVLAALGFLEKDKKRATAWAGLIINGMPCLCGGGLMALGFAMILSGAVPMPT